MTSLTILITNITLTGYSGTEMVVRDLVIGLKKRGHFPMIYCPDLGGVSTEIINADILIVTDLSKLPRAPDIIHGHHHIETIQAILHFPNVPAIFVCHDAQSWHDIPPKMHAIQQFIAVDKNCYERMHINYKISENNINLIFNWFDLTRFPKRDILPEKPKKALVFSSYAKSNTHLHIIEEACNKLQLSLDVIGFGVGKGVISPGQLIGNYDLVFAKAKCAIEALGTGSAVILCDATGLGEMVTTSNIRDFREWNFGRRLLTKPLTKKNILTEIKKYSAIDADSVSHIIRTEANLDIALDTYIALYKKTIENWEKNEKVELNSTIKPYLRYLLDKINVQEHINKQPFIMEALSIEACEKIKLSCLEVPLSVNSSQYFQGKLKINNRSKFNLGSIQLYPVNLSYHWLDAKTNEIKIFEGVRTQINPVLSAKSKYKYQIDIVAPKIPGCYRLAVMLVQESIRWFEDIGQHHVLNEIVNVTD